MPQPTQLTCILPTARFNKLDQKPRLCAYSPALHRAWQTSAYFFNTPAFQTGQILPVPMPSVRLTRHHLLLPTCLFQNAAKTRTQLKARIAWCFEERQVLATYIQPSVSACRHKVPPPLPSLFALVVGFFLLYFLT